VNFTFLAYKFELSVLGHAAVPHGCQSSFPFASFCLFVLSKENVPGTDFFMICERRMTVLTFDHFLLTLSLKMPSFVSQLEIVLLRGDRLLD
jgi:hypothetical protein